MKRLFRTCLRSFQACSQDLNGKAPKRAFSTQRLEIFSDMTEMLAKSPLMVVKVSLLPATFCKSVFWVRPNIYARPNNMIWVVPRHVPADRWCREEPDRKAEYTSWLNCSPRKADAVCSCPVKSWQGKWHVRFQSVKKYLPKHAKSAACM